MNLNIESIIEKTLKYIGDAIGHHHINNNVKTQVKKLVEKDIQDEDILKNKVIETKVNNEKYEPKKKNTLDK